MTRRRLLLPQGRGAPVIAGAPNWSTFSGSPVGVGYFQVSSHHPASEAGYLYCWNLSFASSGSASVAIAIGNLLGSTFVVDSISETFTAAGSDSGMFATPLPVGSGSSRYIGLWSATGTRLAAGGSGGNSYYRPLSISKPAAGNSITGLSLAGTYEFANYCTTY